MNQKEKYKQLKEFCEIVEGTISLLSDDGIEIISQSSDVSFTRIKVCDIYFFITCHLNSGIAEFGFFSSENNIIDPIANLQIYLSPFESIPDRNVYGKFVELINKYTKEN